MNDHKTRGVVIKKTISNISKGNNYILAIAIDKYKHEQIPDLHNAVNDASSIIETLLHKYDYKEAHLTTLYNEAANWKGIYNALERLRKEVRPIDTVLVYFAGHGYYEEEAQIGHLIPQNVKDISDYITHSEFKERIATLNTLHTLLIVDSCFSGNLFSNARSIRTSDAPIESHAKEAYRKPSRWCIAAGGIEEVADGIRGQNSPFATAILNTLSQNTSEQFAVSHLLQQVKYNVSHNSEQRPIGAPLFGMGNSGGEYVFRQKNAVWSGATETNQLSTSNNNKRSIEVAPTSSKKKVPFKQLAIGGVLSLMLFSAFQFFTNFMAPFSEEKYEYITPPEERNLIRTPNGTFIEVKEGTLTMGQELKSNKTKPIGIKHFEIDQYEVTNLQYAAFLKSYGSDVVKKGKYADKKLIETPDLNREGNPKEPFLLKKIDGTWKYNKKYKNHPVANVTWYGAFEYANFYNLRLPTEAEWEYAAKGGHKKPTFAYNYAGSNDIDEVSWNNISNLQTQDNTRLMTGELSPHQVGLKRPNALGIFDMTGNVAEWCSDWSRDVEDSTNFSEIHTQGAIRGGGWFSQDTEYLVWNRKPYTHNSNEGSIFVGFRCVRSR